MAFKLKSGNTTSFKELGSSPAKQTEEKKGKSPNPPENSPEIGPWTKEQVQSNERLYRAKYRDYPSKNKNFKYPSEGGEKPKVKPEIEKK